MLVRRARSGAWFTTAIEAFFAARPDVVLECAGHQAVRDHGVRCLQAGADLVLTSIGALVDDGLRKALEAAALASGRRLISPLPGSARSTS